MEFFAKVLGINWSLFRLKYWSNCLSSFTRLFMNRYKFSCFADFLYLFLIPEQSTVFCKICKIPWSKRPQSFVKLNSNYSSSAYPETHLKLQYILMGFGSTINETLLLFSQLSISGPQTENCAITNFNSPGMWDDTSCDFVPYPYVCEMPASKIFEHINHICEILKSYAYQCQLQVYRVNICTFH